MSIPTSKASEVQWEDQAPGLPGAPESPETEEVGLVSERKLLEETKDCEMDIHRNV